MLPNLEKLMAVQANTDRLYTRSQLVKALAREVEKIEKTWAPGGVYTGVTSLNGQVALFVVYSGGYLSIDGSFIMSAGEAYARMLKLREVGGVHHDFGSTVDGVPAFDDGKVM